MQSRQNETESFQSIVEVAIRAAEVHGTKVPIADLMQLLPDDVTQEQLVRALANVPGFSGGYTLDQGLVVPKASAGSHLQEFNGRLNNSVAYFTVAKRFSERLGSNGVLAIAVSGSTSYRAASNMDDVDLFLVTRSEEMWIVLARALLLTRMMSYSRWSAPPVCLSCIMDGTYARRSFAVDQGALIARDALVAEPVRGSEEYRRLLGLAVWMRKYFPRLYSQRSTTGQPWGHVRDQPSSFKRVLNLFLYVTIGTYIRSKTSYHNIMLARRSKATAKFHARIGPDHLIYESVRYLQLKRTYGEIRPVPEAIPDASSGPGDFSR